MRIETRIEKLEAANRTAADDTEFCPHTPVRFAAPGEEVTESEPCRHCGKSPLIIQFVPATAADAAKACETSTL